MNLNFLCPKSRAGSDSPILQFSTSCDYEIDWYTQLACGTHKSVYAQNTCILYDQQRNIDIDLTPLSKPMGHVIEYSRGLANYKYLLNICGPLNVEQTNAMIGKVKDAEKISAIQMDIGKDAFVKSIGKYTKQRIEYSDGELVMIMEGGDVCGKYSLYNISKFSIN